MKRIAIIAALIVLAGCTDPHATQIQTNVKMPEGLKDCEFYKVKPSNHEYEMLVVRCPAASTSVYEQHSCGKGCTRRNITGVVAE